MPDKGVFCCHHSETLSTVSSARLCIKCVLWFVVFTLVHGYVCIYIVFYNLLMHSFCNEKYLPSAEYVSGVSINTFKCHR